MIHQKDCGRVGQTISHHKILEKSRQTATKMAVKKDTRLPDGQGGQVGEVRNSPSSVFNRMVENFIPQSIPLFFSGSRRSLL